jgi:hypothetical protein
MSKKNRNSTEAADAPRRVAAPRDFADMLGEALRIVAQSEGAVTGSWDRLTDQAKEHWRRRARLLVATAAKLKVRITDAREEPNVAAMDRRKDGERAAAPAGGPA